MFGLVSAFKISDVSPAGLKTCAVFTGLINSEALKPVRGFSSRSSHVCVHLFRRSLPFAVFYIASGPTLQTLSLIYLIA